MSAGGGRCVRAWGEGQEPSGAACFSPDLCAHFTWRFSSPFPQLSFSIVSLCNHLTRSLMKKVHLRTSEDLVSPCRALCGAQLLGCGSGWRRVSTIFSLFCPGGYSVTSRGMCLRERQASFSRGCLRDGCCHPTLPSGPLGTMEMSSIRPSKIHSGQV